jgi:hypothetical protein
MKNHTQRKKENISIFLTVVVLLFAVLLAFPKSGEAIPFTGTGALGSFEGSLQYVPAIPDDSSSVATLTITLTNTSSAANGGYLTGFALNLPDEIIATLQANPTYSGFSQLGGTGAQNAVDAPAYGKFDLGAALGGDFEGGGKPKGGIGVGETATFTFSLSGDLTGFTEDSLLALLSEGTGAGQGYQPFVARFRGFEDDGSDKVPISVPEPGTLILVGAGLLGLGIFGIRKFRGRI